jgi:hypothetical protein
MCFTDQRVCIDKVFDNITDAEIYCEKNRSPGETCLYHSIDAKNVNWYLKNFYNEVLD